MIIDGRWKSILPIKRTMLEYPTEDVTFAYLDALNKLTSMMHRTYDTIHDVVTVDDFVDKAIETPLKDGMNMYVRKLDEINHYASYIASGAVTADFKLVKVVNDLATVLGSEAVDLSADYVARCKLSVSGSTLKAYRDDLTVPKITATDTDLSVGKCGVMMLRTGVETLPPITTFLRPPSTQLPPALKLIELPVIGKGTDDDLIRPDFATNVRNHPKFGKIDTLAVTWGSFDYKNGETMMCIIKDGNPYNPKAVEMQILYAKSRNLIVERPPSDVRSAEELHVKLRKHFDWIAGKHDFAYQTLGYADLEPLAVADFYDGAVEGYYGKDPFKNVPQWELERTVTRWIDRLNRSRVTAELKLKHERKLKRVLKS